MIRLPTVAHFRQNLATVRDFGGEVQITWRFSLSEELYRADTIQASTYITQFPYYQSQSGTGLEMLQRLEMCLLWEARKHLKLIWLTDSVRFTAAEICLWKLLLYYCNRAKLWHHMCTFQHNWIRFKLLIKLKCCGQAMCNVARDWIQQCLWGNCCGIKFLLQRSTGFLGRSLERLLSKQLWVILSVFWGLNDKE